MSLFSEMLIEISRELLHRLPLSRGKERERSQEMRGLCALLLGKPVEVFSLDMHFESFRTDLAKPETNFALV